MGKEEIVMARTVIQNLIDWGKSFVDENGSFYCGTTEEQKRTAANVASDADLWLYLPDVHTRTSSEFAVNGGLYPVHNLVRKDWRDLDKLGVEAGKTVSPELTDVLQEIVRGKPSGLLVPRHVFYQDYDGGEAKPAFGYRDVCDTFGVEKLRAQELMDGYTKYVINAKHMFNGAALQSTAWLGKSHEMLPEDDANVFALLKRKYGQGKDLVINHTGVVTGICIYQTASGVKQIFPKAEVNIISDATTQLLVKELGFGDKEQADKAVRSMCKQVGVNYITSGEYLGSR